MHVYVCGGGYVCAGDQEQVSVFKATTRYMYIASPYMASVAT